MNKLAFKCTAAVTQDDGSKLVNLISTDGKQIKASSIILRFAENDERAKDYEQGKEFYLTIEPKDEKEIQNGGFM